MAKNRLTLGKLLFIVLLFSLLYIFFTGYTRLKSKSSTNFVSFPKVTKTYSDIFSKETLNHLERDLTFFSKGTNPVATFKDKRDNGRILVFKLDFHTTPKLEKVFEISNHIISPQTDVVYNNTRIINNFDIYRTTVPVTFKKITVSFDGEQILKTAQNDSLICYKMLLYAFSLSEKESGKTVINMKSNNSEQNFSQILLLQKKDSIYLLFKNEISSKSKGTNLYNLFIK